jgi:hypothetical protein
MAGQQTNDWGKAWGQVVARAWTDEAFKERLLSNPGAVLREHGLEVPPGIRVKVLEDTAQLVHLSLPKKPGAEELAEEDLGRLAAGASHCCRPCPCGE